MTILDPKNGQLVTIDLTSKPRRSWDLLGSIALAAGSFSKHRPVLVSHNFDRAIS
jgi:hypothetical protein